MTKRKNKKPETKSFIDIKNKSGEIFIFNDIDMDFGFSAQQLSDKLGSLSKESPIKVHINSMGGQITEGFAILNLLRTWQGEVTTIVEGIAGSMAVPILLVGDVRLAEETSLIFMHNPLFGHVSGNADKLEKDIEVLRKVEDQLNTIYESRIDAPISTIKRWLKEETTFTAQEALDRGIVDEIISLPKIRDEINIESLVAKLKTGVKKVTKTKKGKEFLAWVKGHCDLFDIDPDNLTPEQTESLEAKYGEEIASRRKTTRKDPENPDEGDEERKKRNKQRADDHRRISDIESYSRSLRGAKLNKDYIRNDLEIQGVKNITDLVAHAIEEDWSSDKFELECRRSVREDHSDVTIFAPTREKDFNPDVISCALIKASGRVPAKKEVRDKDTKGLVKTFGYETVYNQEVLEASDHPDLRNISICQVLDMEIERATGSRYRGKLGGAGFRKAARESFRTLSATGSTTWTGLDIFDDVANKMLWAAYEAQNTTWQEWVTPVPVDDFKTHNMYRLTVTGGYEQVGADGNLKHGGFTDDKYTVAADTYGKIVGLTRKDIINDDLGALNQIMTSLGIEGARFLEELFYVHFLGQLGTLFPVSGALGNYQSGAGTDLGVDGLTTAEQLFADQVIDDAPLLVGQELILLVGTQDGVLSRELFTKTALQVVQTANAKGRPDENPHAGKFRPVKSPYLNNTNILQRIANKGSAITGQSSDQWFLLMPPNNGMGAIILGAFLNGNQLPTLEQGDAPFDTLGLRWRAFHDAGVGNGDPKLGVMSKGAA